MSDVIQYETGVELDKELFCSHCGEPLVSTPVTLSYMGSAFPVELPACAACSMVYIPEELAKGRILHVEKELEDK